MTYDEHEELLKVLNDVHTKLQQKPEAMKAGIYYNVGSILNAYREGDISFEKACSLLNVNINSTVDHSNELIRK